MAQAPTLCPELIAKAQEVINANRAMGRRVAVAESCTGGLVTAALTSIPGSSEVLDVGFVSYSNAAKMSALGVSEDIIATFGAVSIATAWAMAQGALDRSDADVAISVTGIAGPDGGTKQKPVGTVVFARARKNADPDDVVADSRLFEDDGRDSIRLHAALVALELLLPGAVP